MCSHCSHVKDLTAKFVTLTLTCHSYFKVNLCKAWLKFNPLACSVYRVDSIMLLEEGFKMTSVDASDKMLKYALKERWDRRKEPAFDQWGRRCTRQYENKSSVSSMFCKQHLIMLLIWLQLLMRQTGWPWGRMCRNQVMVSMQSSAWETLLLICQILKVRKPL